MFVFLFNSDFEDTLLDGLRKAGYEIPTPRRVSIVVTGPDGRVYTMPGGGYELQFPFEIPGKFVEVLPLR